MTGDSLPARRNSEEQDQLERSTKKKTKTSTESPMGEALPTMGAGGQEAMTSEKYQGTPSFKQILANETAGNAHQMVEEIDLVSDDEEELDDDVDKSCPVIRLTRDEKVRLRSRWKQTLIVKVMGRNVGYGYLLKRLTSLWRPKARMELVTVDNGYFLAKFSSVDDYEFAKYGGPWMVLDHYLIVKEWIPNFDPFTEKTESMIVWIRFPCLPAEYFDHSFLMRVGGKIGRPINIDTATSLVSRASFARVCVEVDITKPLLSKFTLRNRVRPIVYEGLHLICFKCGMYGHNANGCSPTKDDGVAGETNIDGENHPEKSTGAGNGNTEGGKGKQSMSLKPTLYRPEIMEDYGIWMIAQKPKRNYATNPGNKNQGERDSGKRNHEKKEQLAESNGKKTTTDKRKTKNQDRRESGSRFATLADDELHGVHEDVTTEEENLEEPKETSNPSQNPKTAGPSKGRRSTVQASERQIEGNNKYGTHKQHTDNGVTNPSQTRRELQTKNVPNRAAAENEHTLVMGDRSGASSSQVVCLDDKERSELLSLEELYNPEHHGDPPATEVDDGTTVADDESFMDSFENPGGGDMEVET